MTGKTGEGEEEMLMLISYKDTSLETNPTLDFIPFPVTSSFEPNRFEEKN